MTWENFRPSVAERIREVFWRDLPVRRHGEWTRLRNERNKERLRIARELHDTLLQGFLSASMQLCLADDQLAADSPAKPVLRQALNLMRKVIDEGRAAVLGLRSPELPEGSLEQALCHRLDDFAPSDRARLRIIILGQARPLDPAIFEEIYRVVCEAMRNALTHSEANTVEVEIEYLRRKLRIRVRDNGIGIDSQILESGKSQHWGLTGMRERAATAGAKIRVWSKRGRGTEVEISVPMEGRGLGSQST